MVIVKINERTKDGKALLEFLKAYSTKSEGVEIVDTSSDEKKIAASFSSNMPNEETLKVFIENDQNGLKGLKKYNKAEDLFEDMGL